jgi:CBS-domain-containing membrane protein
MYHTLPLEQLAGDTCGTISEEATVQDAAEQIRMNDLCGLSVLSEDQHLGGFITPCSLLPALSAGCLLGLYPAGRETEKEAYPIETELRPGDP